MKKLVFLFSIVFLVSAGSAGIFPSDPMKVYGDLSYSDGSDLETPVEVTAYVGEKCIGSTNESSHCHWSEDGSSGIFTACETHGTTFSSDCSFPSDVAYEMQMPNPDNLDYSSFQSPSGDFETSDTPIKFYVNGEFACNSVTWESFASKRVDLSVPRSGDCDAPSPPSPGDHLFDLLGSIFGFLNLGSEDTGVDRKDTDLDVLITTSRDGDSHAADYTLETTVQVEGDDEDWDRKDKIVMTFPERLEGMYASGSFGEFEVDNLRDYSFGSDVFTDTVDHGYTDTDGDGEDDSIVLTPAAGREFENPAGSQELEFRYEFQLLNWIPEGNVTTKFYDNGGLEKTVVTPLPAE